MINKNQSIDSLVTKRTQNLAALNFALQQEVGRRKEIEVLLEQEKRMAHELLEGIFPKDVVSRLSMGESSIADRLDDVTVIFADMTGFYKFFKFFTCSCFG